MGHGDIGNGSPGDVGVAGSGDGSPRVDSRHAEVVAAAAACRELQKRSPEERLASAHDARAEAESPAERARLDKLIATFERVCRSRQRVRVSSDRCLDTQMATDAFIAENPATTARERRQARQRQALVRRAREDGRAPDAILSATQQSFFGTVARVTTRPPVRPSTRSRTAAARPRTTHSPRRAASNRGSPDDDPGGGDGGPEPHRPLAVCRGDQGPVVA